ncbi:hypothetical protein AYI70_g1715 [Smittium culicis]|uniref:Uncharacterized protein n=1 Tax=Smittium culicis TaxID=133412 RepID=A0A1R1YBE2_9FUNG|nr:hypothetical protein AYI70_g1715 [Smittium culicis]
MNSIKIISEYWELVPASCLRGFWKNIMPWKCDNNFIEISNMISNLKIDCLNIDENSDEDEFCEDLLYKNENYLSSSDEKYDEIQTEYNFI